MSETTRDSKKRDEDGESYAAMLDRRDRFNERFYGTLIIGGALLAGGVAFFMMIREAFMR